MSPLAWFFAAAIAVSAALSPSDGNAPANGPDLAFAQFANSGAASCMSVAAAPTASAYTD